MIKLVIFDWDDVFTKDSIKGYYLCYHKALQDIGVTLPKDEEDQLIKDKWGSGYHAQLEYILEKKGCSELLDKALERYREHFFGGVFMDCLGITPGSQDFLRDIAQRYKLTVATGGHPTILKEQFMPKFEIPDVFEHILTIYDIDDLAHAKPHPYMAKKSWN